MSELAQLTGAPASNDDVLPGYVLSPWTLLEISEAEQEFEQSHLRMVAIAAASAVTTVRNELLSQAQEAIASGYFVYGSPGFWLKMRSVRELAFLLWLSLRGKQQQMTREAAGTLITIDNFQKIQDACRKCAGWKPPVSPPNLQGGQGTTPTKADAPPSAPPQSPGDVSTASSPVAA
jgi:hypothetical protein